MVDQIGKERERERCYWRYDGLPDREGDGGRVLMEIWWWNR